MFKLFSSLSYDNYSLSYSKSLILPNFDIFDLDENMLNIMIIDFF